MRARKRLVCAFVVALALTAALLWYAAGRDTAPGGAPTPAGLGMMLVDEPEGVTVLAVKAHSAAQRSGVQPGDVLISAQGVAVDAAASLEALLEQSPPIDILHLHFDRNGAPVEITLVCE